MGRLRHEELVRLVAGNSPLSLIRLQYSDCSSQEGRGQWTAAEGGHEGGNKSVRGLGRHGSRSMFRSPRGPSRN